MPVESDATTQAHHGISGLEELARLCVALAMLMQHLSHAAGPSSRGTPH